MNKTFLISPGEFLSIGLEVSLKALESISSFTDVFILYTNQDYLEKHKGFTTKNLIKIDHPSINLSPGIYYIDSNEEPVDWFKQACTFSANNPLTSAVVTGPLIKSSFKDPNILGHTDYLRSTFPDHKVFMTFFSDNYNCLLLNDHQPLSSIFKDLDADKIKSAVDLIRKVQSNAKIGLLGLNPHAGENGLIGGEEVSVHTPVTKKLKISGPLSPDGFFSIEDYKKFNFIIANYHDQGLMPFKLLNGFKASQASLGLPFIRTSVNHGTSDKLFLKGIANPSSMIHAIQLAQNLLNNNSI